MKKILIVMMAALLVMALAACAVQPAAGESAQIANPWTAAADAEEVKEKTGLTMSALPEGAADVSYSVMESEKIAQAAFTWNGDEYTFRMAPDGATEDLSGMYVEFKTDEDMLFGDYPYEIKYNEGAEGLAEWDDELTKTEYSVTMQTGATKEKLAAVSEALIPAG
ncbi:MAG: hypothetical protein DELT_03334 [Desulfovibrio sp.]|uniref:hypothetical protein n=1 Tax=Christensenella intestinihominis TaxID=1851429 RepID=UPI00082D99A5|nr:hypothetical protein [Christensenella intestinihominis]